MANPFDQFDEAPTGGNPFDQFDESPATPKRKVPTDFNFGGVSLKGKPTDTRKVSYTDSGYRPNKKAETPRELAKNLVQDVVELPLAPVRMLGDIANAPDTSKAAWETAKGLITAPLGFVPGVSEMATGRTAAENWLTNPGIGASLVAPVVRGAQAIGKSVPNVLDRPRNAVAQGLNEMTLKQLNTLPDLQRNANNRLSLQEGYKPSSKGVAKLDAAIERNETMIQNAINSGNEARMQGTFDRAIMNLEAMRDKARKSSDPFANLAKIDAEIDILRKHPLLDESGKIDVAALQEMKVRQGREISAKYGAESAFQVELDKARVRGFKEEIQSVLEPIFPELEATNRKLSNYYQLRKQLTRAAKRIENNQGFGIGMPIKAGTGAAIGGMLGGPTGAAIGSGIGTFIGLVEHPRIAPTIAQLLYKESKGKMTYKQALDLTKQRLSTLKQTLPAASVGSTAQEADKRKMEQAMFTTEGY